MYQKFEIENSWCEILRNETNSQYFNKLIEFILHEKKTQTVYPPEHLIFNAFNLTSYDKLKVVILGQDPYHGHGQAHGLCFSVPEGIAQPPSLKNIFKELKDDVGIEIPSHGNLTKWAEQGVLLLNATLTVRANSAGSHQKKGWEKFTDATIKLISENKKNIVFILWGNFAKAKINLIDASKHLIL